VAHDHRAPKYPTGIVRYIRHRSTNGMTEGFNNKIKLIQRRAFE
jgi:transposase